MFLRENNTVNWKKMLAAAVVTMAVCALGVMWFDAPVYMFMRRFDWFGWGILDSVFEAKIWLAIFAIISLIFFVKSKFNPVKFIKKFKVRNFFAKFRELSNGNPAFVIFCSVLFSAMVAGALKVILGRARPIFFEALNHTGFYHINFEWAFNSMPSGHAAASFAGLVALGLLRPRFKIITWGLAVVIGASRVAYGAHWPTDVILGAFIGMAAADIVRALAIKK